MSFDDYVSLMFWISGFFLSLSYLRLKTFQVQSNISFVSSEVWFSDSSFDLRLLFVGILEVRRKTVLLMEKYLQYKIWTMLY